MANEFKIKKGLIVEGASGGTVVNVLGSQGQLLSVTDNLSGSIFAVSDISGVPIFDVNSSGVSYFDGKVGIGVANPSSKLTIETNAGDGTIELLAVNAATTKNKIIFSEAILGDESFFIEHDGAGAGADNLLKIHGDGSGGTASGITIRRDGRVGIGTDSPGYELSVNGNIEAGKNVFQDISNKGGFIMRPWGADYLNTTTNIHTGAIKIKLPTGAATEDDMIKFTIDIYQYSTNESLSIDVGGYVYRNAGLNDSWRNVTAIVHAKSITENYTVRFGDDGTNHCVWVGELDTVWNHPNVICRNFYGGFAVETEDYLSEWDISFEATSFSHVSKTQSNNFPLSSGGVDGGFLPLSAGASYPLTGPLYITSDGSAANGAEIYLKHANNNTTDTIGTLFFGNNADATLSSIVVETNGANNTSNLKLNTSNAGTMSTALTLQGDNDAIFTGNVGIGTTDPLAPLHIVTPAIGGIDLTDISRTADNLVRFTNPQYSTSATMGLLLRVFPDSDARQGAGLLMTGGSDNAASNLSLFVSKDDGSGNNISKSYSALHIAGNTSNVGIGTTSPLTKLHIAGTTNANIIRIENTATALSAGDTIGAIQFFNNDTTDDSPNVAASIYATAGASGGSGSLRFKTTEPGTEGNPATDTMIITNGGRVGIGTLSPDKDLTVGGINPTHGINLRTKSGTSEWLLWQVEQYFSQEGYMRMFNDNVAKIQFRAGGDSYFVGGDVGIGTTSPDFKLDVGGTLGVSDLPGNASSTSVLVRNETIGPELLSNGDFTGNPDLWGGDESITNGQLTKTGNGLAYQSISLTGGATYFITVDVASISGTPLIYATGLQSGGLSLGLNELYLVAGSANSLFGINNGSGSVFNSISLKLVTSASNQIQTRQLGSSAFSETEYWKANGNDIYNTNSANVGIGTTSPTQSKLVISGGATGTVGGGDAGITMINKFDNPDNSWSILPVITGVSNTGFSIRDNTDSADRLVIDGSGKVGIGTASPDSKLSVTSTTLNSEDILYLKSGADNVNDYLGIAWELGVGGNGPHSAIRSFAGPSGSDARLGFLTTSNGGTTLTEGLSVAHDGNVGIGTVTPGAKLDVNSNISASSVDVIKISQNTNGAIKAAASLGLSIQNGGEATNAADLWFTTAANGSLAERLRIKSDGNVGIGDTAPTSISANTFSLSINSSRNDLTGALISKANGSIRHQQYWDSSGYGFNLTASSGDFKWNFGSSEKMRLTEAGNLGIGTTTPLAKLDIQGTQGQLFSVTDDLSGSIFAVADISGVPIFDVNSSGVSYFDGKVGIGTTTPSYKLVVDNRAATTTATQSPQLFLTGGSNVGTDYRDGQITVGSDSVTCGSLAWSNASAGVYLDNRWNNNIGFIAFRTKTSGTANEVMRLTGPGKVGIGVTAPGRLLQVGDTPTIGDNMGAIIKGYSNALDVRTNEANNMPDFQAAINLYCDGVVGSSGTGTGIYFKAKTGGGGGGEYTLGRIQGAIYTSWTTNTDATRTSKMVIQTTNSSTTVDKVTILGTGATTFVSTVTATNFILSSDKTLKENIKNIDSNYIHVDWKNFELKSEPGIKRYGVIAQELEEKHPEFVRTDDEGLKSVAYIDLLIAKIAELEARLEKAGL
jgi:hypothetical protein